MVDGKSFCILRNLCSQYLVRKIFLKKRNLLNLLNWLLKTNVAIRVISHFSMKLSKLLVSPHFTQEFSDLNVNIVLFHCERNHGTQRTSKKGRGGRGSFRGTFRGQPNMLDRGFW